jgi:hypothetical protein
MLAYTGNNDFQERRQDVDLIENEPGQRCFL